MALTKNTPRIIELGDYNDLPVEAGGLILQGAAVGVAASGFARELTTADTFAGFADGMANNRQGAAGDINVRTRKRGHVVLDVAGQLSVGAPVYALGNDQYSTAGSLKIGSIERVQQGGRAVVRFEIVDKGAAQVVNDVVTGQSVIVGPDGYPVFEATSQYQSLASIPGLIAFWDFSEPRAPFVSKAGRGRLALFNGTGSKVRKGATSPTGNSVVFNGSSDYLIIQPSDIGALNIGSRGKSSVTVLALYKRAAVAATHFIGGIWREDNNDPRRQYGLFESLPMYGGNRKVCMHISKTGGPSAGLPYSRDYSANGVSEIDFTWEWVAGTYDGAAIKSYLNGKFEPYTGYTEPGSPNGQGLTYDKNPYVFTEGLNSAPAEFTVGACKLTSGYSNFAIGELALLAVFDTALTAQQIADVQNMLQASASGFKTPLFRLDTLDTDFGVSVLGSKAYSGAAATDQSASATGVFRKRAATPEPVNSFIYRPASTPAGIAAFVHEIVAPGITTENLDKIKLELSNANTTDQVRLMVKIGGAWFATEATFVATNASASGSDWSQSNVLDFQFTRAAASWRDVTLTPGTALSLSGVVRSQPLPEGEVTGWGLLSPTTPTGILRFRNQEFVTY